MMAMPRPEHYSDMVELPRAFACHGCDARVALTTADPLPAGWRVTAGVDPVYTCPRCARGLGRPGGRSAVHAAKPMTKHVAKPAAAPAAGKLTTRAQRVEAEPADSPASTTAPMPAPTPVSSSASTLAPDAPSPRPPVGGAKTLQKIKPPLSNSRPHVGSVGAWIFFCPCGFERRELARFLVHAAMCRARRAEEATTP